MRRSAPPRPTPGTGSARPVPTAGYPPRARPARTRSPFPTPRTRPAVPRPCTA
ncbi:regulator, partial [Streptomyces sp. NTH33]